MKLPANTQLLVGEYIVNVSRRRKKGLTLKVASPLGEICVSAPLKLSDVCIEQFVRGQHKWISEHRTIMQRRAARYQRKIGVQPGKAASVLSNRWIRVFSRRYSLKVEETRTSRAADSRKLATETLNSFTREPELIIKMPSSYDEERRLMLLWRWYEQHLENELDRLVTKWEAKLGVSVDAWRIIRMKTRWGSCNTRMRRVTFNLELARRPLKCLEFVVVHELVHLIERGHTHRFYKLMDYHFPFWRRCKSVLDSVPIAVC